MYIVGVIRCGGLLAPYLADLAAVLLPRITSVHGFLGEQSGSFDRRGLA